MGILRVIEDIREEEIRTENMSYISKKKIVNALKKMKRVKSSVLDSI